jgi:hypothetical protein
MDPEGQGQAQEGAAAMSTVRLRATLTMEYDAAPENYGTDDPLDMAALDAACDDAFMLFGEADSVLTVEPV